MSESTKDSNKIDWQELERNHKKNNFKRMKVIDHGFLYSCFHPRKDNIVMCLEKNHYPEDMEIFDLRPKKDENEKAKEEELKQGD